MNFLANIYHADGRRDAAHKLHEEVLAVRKAKLGPDHPDTLRSMSSLATSYDDAGRGDEALKLREEVLAERKAKLGPDHPDTLASMNSLALAYQAAGQIDRALPIRRELVAARKRLSGPESLIYANSLRFLGDVLLETKGWAEAERVLRESLRIREAKQPEGWMTPDVRSMLGAALFGQGKAAEAEPLLQVGYEGMVKRADKIPANNKVRLAESLDRLIAFGEATGKAEEVKAWKAERAKLNDPARWPKEAVTHSRRSTRLAITASSHVVRRRPRSPRRGTIPRG